MKNRILSICLTFILAFCTTNVFATTSFNFNGEVLHQDGKILINGESMPSANLMFVVLGPQTSKDALYSSETINTNPALAVGAVFSAADAQGKFSNVEVLLKDGIEAGYYSIIGGYETGAQTKAIQLYYIDEGEANDIISRAKAVTASNVDSFYTDFSEKLTFDTSLDATQLQSTKNSFVECKTRTIYNNFDTIEDIKNAWYSSAELAEICTAEISEITEIINSCSAYMNISDTTVSVDIREKFIQALYDNRTTITSWSAYDTMFDKLVALAKVNTVERSGMTAVIQACAADLGITITDYYIANSATINMSLAKQKFKTVEAFKAAYTTACTPPASSGSSSASPSGGNGNGSGSGSGSYVVNYQPAVTQKDLYTDISHVSWAHEAIEYLSRKNIMNGTGNGNFEPDRAITREEFAKILVSSAKLSVGSDDCTFEDVLIDKWYYPYVSTAYANGLVYGYSEKEFGVGRNITRIEMVYMVDRAIRLKGINAITIQERENVSFSDCTEEEAIRLYKSGIINGMGDGKFAPKETASRAQAAQIIYGLLTTYPQYMEGI